MTLETSSETSIDFPWCVKVPFIREAMVIIPDWTLVIDVHEQDRFATRPETDSGPDHDDPLRAGISADQGALRSDPRTSSWCPRRVTFSDTGFQVRPGMT
ncbi:MAG: hypothetical protein J4G15_05815 [Alphaproteobacteria bacterium]|nr:hypothetical protein [Alphaproteobacteria bacterium]